MHAVHAGHATSDYDAGRRMSGARDRWQLRASAMDARLLAEALVVILVVWVLLGWRGDIFSRGDGDVMWQPYLRSSLEAGADWTQHLYRFGMVGGSAMHDAAGTLPIVSVGAALGMEPAGMAIIVALFIQLLFAYFALVGVRGLGRFFGAAELSWFVRACVIVSAAFAPWLAWRLAYAHENLLFGLVPFYAATMLIAAARTQTPSALSLVITALATWHAFATVGAQMVVYGVWFGAPLLVAIALIPGTQPRWSRGHTAIACALVAGFLLALPRFAGMLAYATGPDFPRDENLLYSFASATGSDLLRSLTWALHHNEHETNVPLGPFVVIAIASWPRSRATLYTLGAVIVVALLFAMNATPIATLVGALPGMAAFRVPLRALLIPLALVAPLAFAALSARLPEFSRRDELVAALLGVAILVLGLHIPAIAREVLAWAAAVAIILRRPTIVILALAALTALGAVAARDRFPWVVARDPIDAGPAELQKQILAHAPELANPLNRIEIPDAPQPYAMSFAAAAGLSSLDGVWWPTRRYLALQAALKGRSLPSTTMVFAQTHERTFPILAQLYNVRYVLRRTGEELRFESISPPGAPAWFPTRIARAATADEVGAALRANSRDTAWVLDGDASDLPATCTGRVLGTRVDGQRATINVDTQTPCVLVVATNIVSELHATTAGTELTIVPVDIALVGIVVPPGHHDILLAPEPFEPAWARNGGWLGVLALIGAVALPLLARRVP